MIIGIISDTHNNTSAALKAAELFLQHNVQHVFHCGDVGTAKVLSVMTTKLIPAGIPIHVVLGNCDLYSGIDIQLERMSGITFHGRCGHLELNGKRMAFYHGDDYRTAENISSEAPDYIFTGHTHLRHDERIGDSRHINPGAMRNTSQPSVAILDLQSNQLTFLDI